MRRLCFLFFLSGAAGLVYQVVWSRVLHEIFGVSVYATTAVLATFLGGLALGALVLGRLADRTRNPLRLFGWLEIGSGLAALASTWVSGALEPLHVWAANRFAADATTLIALRMLLAAVVILPPTFLMGGTLPVITRAAVVRLPQVGRVFSALYALNTLGAVVGSLAAGFVLIRTIGLHPTLWLAVAINLVVGTASLWLAAAEPATQPLEQGQVQATETRTPPASGGVGLLAVMGLSGFASLGLEVLWTRMLVLSVGTTTYAFVTMLAAFLTGIAAGGAVARVIVDRVRDLRATFGWVQLGIALSVLATLPWISFGVTQELMRGRGTNWLLLICMRFGVSFLVMLVPTTLIGMTLPLAAKIWTREVRTLGGRLGQLYGANTLGNILGALVSGFVLLPLIGLQRGIVVLSAIFLLVAAWGLFPRAAEGPVSRRGAALRAWPVVVIGLGLLALLPWKPEPFKSWQESPNDLVRYYREGVAATVKVLQSSERPRVAWMTVDGITIGQSFGGVDAKQQALAHFPFLLLPRKAPRDVLSIGLGTGILIGEVVKHRGVRRVDCLEISPAVIEAARLFDRYSGDVLEHPAVNVIHDDGVNFLRRTRSRYDAIISDAKSRTAHAGNSAFFSADYYQLCRNRLHEGGLMIQWVPLDVPPNELQIILRTFLSVFPSVYVWVSPPHSAFLVGSEQSLVLDLDHIERLLQDPSTANLRRYGWRDPDGFVSLLMADRASLEPWLSLRTTVNTLERPVLEFYSPWEYTVPPGRRRAANLEGLRAAWQSTLDIVWVDAIPADVVRNRGAAANLVEAFALLERLNPALVEQALDRLDDAIRAAPQLGFLRNAAPRIYRRVLALHPDSLRANKGLGSLLMSEGRFAAAAGHFRKWVEITPDDAQARRALGLALSREEGRD